MNLLDGLEYFKTYDDSDWQFTLEVEKSAVEVVKLISQQGSRPSAAALAAGRDLLIDIEKWKAMCLQEQTGNAAKNSEEAVCNAFRTALEAPNARNDRETPLNHRAQGFWVISG